MKKMMYSSWLLLVLLVVFVLLFAGCKPSVTGRLAGDGQVPRYQQLAACEAGGRSMAECRSESAITVERYQEMMAQAGDRGEEEQLPDGEGQGGAPPREPQTYNIAIENSAFAPSRLEITIGDTVVWTNRDQAVHTVTQGQNHDFYQGGFDSGNIAQGASFSHTFNNRYVNSGTFDYFCRRHQAMEAQIIVNEVARPEGDGGEPGGEGGEGAEPQDDVEDQEPPGGGEPQACANAEECVEGLRCLYGFCQTRTCTETDSENDPAVPGVATLDNSVSDDVLRRDECVEGENQVRQFFCIRGGVNSNTIVCPEGTTCQLVDDVAVCQGAGEPQACANAEECVEGLRCLYGFCQTQTCTETDAGNDPTTPGIATLDNSVSVDVLRRDECIEGQNRVMQFSCTPAGGVSGNAVACPANTTCQPNAEDVAVCQGAPPVERKVAGAECPTQQNAECQEGLLCLYSRCQTQTCTDTDQANNPAVPGVATLDNSINPDRVQKDTCIGTDRVQEYACSPGSGLSGRGLVFPCPQGTTCQLNAEDVASCQGAGAGDAPPAGPQDGQLGGRCEGRCEGNLICETPPGQDVGVCIEPKKVRNAECPTQTNAECVEDSVCRRLFVTGDKTRWAIDPKYYCKAPMAVDGICDRADQCIDNVCRNNRCVDTG